MGTNPGVSGIVQNVNDRWLAGLGEGPAEENPFASADSLTQIFPELQGISPKNANIAFSSSLTFVGINNSLTNNSVSAVAKLFPTFGGGVYPDTMFFSIDFALGSGGSGGDFVEFDIFLADLHIGEILGAGSEVVDVDLIDVSALAAGEFFREVRQINTAGLGEYGDLIAVGVKRDATAGNPADTFSGNVTLIDFTLILPNSAQRGSST